jgi:hypothetical protein
MSTCDWNCGATFSFCGTGGGTGGSTLMACTGVISGYTTGVCPTRTICDGNTFSTGCTTGTICGGNTMMGACTTGTICGGGNTLGMCPTGYICGGNTFMQCVTGKECSSGPDLFPTIINPNMETMFCSGGGSTSAPLFCASPILPVGSNYGLSSGYLTPGHSPAF